jgi:DNA-directed RNA polymerase specialized sigma subunit
MNGPPSTPELRENVINYFNTKKNNTYKEIANHFNTSPSRVYLILDKYFKDKFSYIKTK